MVEAGTGVGKSFAYLVPAILAAVEKQQKIVVSTHTISLQEQLLQKDIPFLRSVMPHEFSAVLVKGRSNYISIRRLEAATARAGASFAHQEEIDQLGALRVWAGRTTDGSRSDLDFRPLPAVWDAVESDHGNCLGPRCKTYNSCHYFKARRRSYTANILIVNHALYMTDVSLRAGGSSFLPEHDVVIFDEAHTLPDVAGAHLGLRIGSGAVTYLLNRLANPRTQKGLLVYHKLDGPIRQARLARTAADEFFEEIRHWRDATGPSNGRAKKPLPIHDRLGEELRKLASSISSAAESITEDEQRIELTAASDRCLGLATGLRDWIRQAHNDSVYWVEVEPRDQRRVTLACTPLDVGPLLRKHLFERIPSCILTSATLSVGKPPSFTYSRSRLGLLNSESKKLGSPFDYRRQATIHLVNNLPDPSLDSGGFEQAAIRAIPGFLEKTSGKAFVLFTSYRMLESSAKTLAPWFAARGIRLLTQSDGMPRTKLLETFKADEDSVLFGVESFWQGVDVPGRALSNVIITRLPFSVPDEPLAQAQSESLKARGGDYFREVSRPEAVL
jgi:ATP-dependent DNA helicase DinG